MSGCFLDDPDSTLVLERFWINSSETGPEMVPAISWKVAAFYAYRHFRIALNAGAGFNAKFAVEG